MTQVLYLRPSHEYHFRHRTGRIQSVSDHWAGRVINPKHQSVYMAHVTRCQRYSKMWTAERDAQPVEANWGKQITQSTFGILSHITILLSLPN